MSCGKRKRLIYKDQICLRTSCVSQHLEKHIGQTCSLSLLSQPCSCCGFGKVESALKSPHYRTYSQVTSTCFLLENANQTFICSCNLKSQLLTVLKVECSQVLVKGNSVFRECVMDTRKVKQMCQTLKWFLCCFIFLSDSHTGFTVEFMVLYLQ